SPIYFQLAPIEPQRSVPDSIRRRNATPCDREKSAAHPRGQETMSGRSNQRKSRPVLRPLPALRHEPNLDHAVLSSISVRQADPIACRLAHASRYGITLPHDIRHIELVRNVASPEL